MVLTLRTVIVSFTRQLMNTGKEKTGTFIEHLCQTISKILMETQKFCTDFLMKPANYPAWSRTQHWSSEKFVKMSVKKLFSHFKDKKQYQSLV